MRRKRWPPIRSVWGWRDFFSDPYLQELIERGLAQNTDVLTAGLRIEEAQAALLSAKLAFLPSFALAPQGSLGTVESQVSRTYTLPVTASWELDIFGKLRNAKRQAKAAYAQSEDYQQAVYSSLIANIANNYYTLLMLDEQLAISRETAASWKETVASTQALMDAGLADETAVSQMKGTYYEVENSVIDLEEQISQVDITKWRIPLSTWKNKSVRWKTAFRCCWPRLRIAFNGENCPSRNSLPNCLQGYRCVCFRSVPMSAWLNGSWNRPFM